MIALRPYAVPAFLFLCLLLGGSRQGVWGNALLQLLAVAIIAWAALARDTVERSKPARTLILLAAAALGLLVLQLVPLPPGLWTALPGRGFAVEGYRLLGIDLPWLPVSLAPAQTIQTALALLPPLAVIVGMVRLGAFRQGWLALAIVTGTAASVMLGALQVGSGGQSYYLYRFSNYGVAAGFFANSNHMGALLLAAIPLAAAAASQRWTGEGKSGDRSLLVLLAAGAAVVLALGMVINRSLAVLMLALPVLVATAAMLLRGSKRRVPLLAAGGALALAAVIALVIFAKDIDSGGGTTSIERRAAMWEQTIKPLGEHWPTGTGIGTFEQVYRGYEDPATIDRFYVNHAHNDYLEIVLETGVPGMILLLLFLAWWTRRAVAAWSAPSAPLFARAGSIASAALLLHSLVDYPLRTAALSSVMAACLALMASAVSIRAAAPGERRPARHATL